MNEPGYRALALDRLARATVHVGRYPEGLTAELVDQSAQRGLAHERHERMPWCSLAGDVDVRAPVPSDQPHRGGKPDDGAHVVHVGGRSLESVTFHVAKYNTRIAC